MTRASLKFGLRIVETQADFFQNIVKMIETSLWRFLKLKTVWKRSKVDTKIFGKLYQNRKPALKRKETSRNFFSSFFFEDTKKVWPKEKSQVFSILNFFSIKSYLSTFSVFTITITQARKILLTINLTLCKEIKTVCFTLCYPRIIRAIFIDAESKRS